MSLSAKLGYVFIAPALVLVVVFFLTPVVLTGIFSFTNMSTATGITGGAYQITPSLLRDLSGKGFEKKTLDAIGAESYQVSQTTLQVAREAGSSPDLLTELEADHLGSSFKNRREFERFLKKLQNRRFGGPRPETPRLVKNYKIEDPGGPRKIIEKLYPERSSKLGNYQKICRRPNFELI